MQKYMFALLALAFVSLTALTSCQPKGCTDPMSDNYDPKAKENDGSCVPWRDKFIGNYPGKNGCAGFGEQDVNIAITASGTSDDGIVIAVPAVGLLFTAKATGSTNLIIPSQQITYQSATVTISGSGSLINDLEIQIDYVLANPPISNICVLTGKKL